MIPKSVQNICTTRSRPLVLAFAFALMAILVVAGVSGCGKKEKEPESTVGQIAQKNVAAKKSNKNPRPSGPLTEQQAIEGMLQYDGHVIREDQNKPDSTINQIWFKGNNATDEGVEYVNDFPNVVWLQFQYYNYITDAGLAHISAMKKLERLEINAANITDAGLIHLKNLSTLRILSLSFSGVTDSGLVHLKGLTALEKLDLDDTKVTEQGVKNLQQALPKCKIFINTLTNASVDGSKTPAGNAGRSSNVSASASSTSMTYDWEQWRGPNRDSLCAETGLMQEWPPEGPPLLWENKEVGRGHSAAVIHNGKVFSTGRIGSTSFLIAIDSENGEKLWKTTIAEAGEDTLSTPTIDGDFIYTVACEGNLTCVRISDGEVIWQRSFPKEFGGDYQCHGTGGGYAESVLIDGDKLICTPGAKDAMIACLDKNTGKTIWTAKFPSDVGEQGNDLAGFSSPVISHACGIKQYIQLAGRGLISLAPDDGRVLWVYNGVANEMYNISTPIVRDDYVFASTCHFGNPHAGTALLKLVPDKGGIKPEVVYRLEKRVASNHHGGMVLVGDYVYMGHGYNRGFPLCMEFLTGKIVWRPGRGPGTGSAAVLYAEGNLYFRYEGGTMALIEANPAKYVVKSKFDCVSDNVNEWSHPVISHRRLYIRGKLWLRSYDIAKK